LFEVAGDRKVVASRTPDEVEWEIEEPNVCGGVRAIGIDPVETGQSQGQRDARRIHVFVV
jgi:hypothetical protein